VSRGGGVVGQREHRRRKQQREQPAYGARPSRPSLRPDEAGSQRQADCVVPAHHKVFTYVEYRAVSGVFQNIGLASYSIISLRCTPRLNIELNLQIFFGLLSTALLIG
jgi:hypothetical protein